MTALPRRTIHNPAEPDLNRQAKTCHAELYLPCQAVPQPPRRTDHADPYPAKPRPPQLAVTRLTVPFHDRLNLPCPTKPNLTLLNHAQPEPPFLAVPQLTSSRRAFPQPPSHSEPSRTLPILTATASPCLTAPCQTQTNQDRLAVPDLNFPDPALPPLTASTELALPCQTAPRHT